MYQTPMTPQTPQHQKPEYQQPARPKCRFRWEIIAVILTVLVFLWFIKGIEPSFEFEELMRTIGIRHSERFIRFASLAVVGLAIIFTVKLFRNKKEK